jgi:predicted TIM-barrel fold metal-dependent hydrolase
MIVDVHSHFPFHRGGLSEEAAPKAPPWRPDKAVSLTNTWADYDRAMEAVDTAIVFNIARHPGEPEPREQDDLMRPAREVNDLTAEFARERRGKVIGFMTVHPHDPDPLGEIDRGVHELGLRGIKLGLNYQRAELLGKEARAIYAKAEKMRLPIVFHTGTSPMRFAPLEYAYPLHFDRIAIAFPELKIVMAHLGHPWQADTCVVVRKHPNVFADVSAQFYRPWSMYQALRLATEWGVMHKLLFGSDFPVATPAETMKGTRAVNDILEGTKLPRVPEEAIEAIIHRDTLGLLGLA